MLPEHVSPRSWRRLILNLHSDYAPHLQKLPWHKPLSEWKKNDARFLQVKSGLSRHPVRFVTIRGKAFAIKETSAKTARREIECYTRLLDMQVPALLPLGLVIRENDPMATETTIGVQIEPDVTGYVITQLLDYSIPHLYLFKRMFAKENRYRIWDSIVRLFVRLHLKGIYWGDASLSNMMIVFTKEHFPEIGIRTVIKAVLADAETVEFHSSLSEQLRISDLETFFESMAWTDEDLRLSGILREPLVTGDDQEYIRKKYLDLFAIEQEEQSFEIITEIDVDKLLGPFEQMGQAKALLQHIYEHKWYLSERQQLEVSVGSAAKDWYITVFKPVLKLFAEYRVLDEFPEMTASSLYLDVMLHKYYLSEKFGRDIGLSNAFESYIKLPKNRNRGLEKSLKLARSMKHLFR